jgi:hypothetical protein
MLIKRCKGMVKAYRFLMRLAAACLSLTAMQGAADAQNGNATLPIVNGTPFTSGPVTVDNAHCGYDYVLGGGAFYSASVGAASAFATGCTIAFTNTDNSACKGKSINVNGFAALFVLWPGQMIELTQINGAWVETVNPGRWRPNCGGTPLIINTDSTSGSDTAGVSDGLGTGTEAFKSVHYALQYVLTDFDFAGTPQTQVKVLMASGSTDATQVHYTPHAIQGAQGGAAITIDGNGGSLTGGVQFYLGATIQIRNVTLSNASGSCIISTLRAYVEVLDLVTFGACTGAQIAISENGIVEFFNNFTISGGAAYFIQNQSGLVVANALTATISANITYSQDTIFGFFPGSTQLSAITWSLGGHTVTGTKYDIEGNHVLTGSSNVPGTVAGTTATGGQAL